MVDTSPIGMKFDRIAVERVAMILSSSDFRGSLTDTFIVLAQHKRFWTLILPFPRLQKTKGNFWNDILK